MIPLNYRSHYPAFQHNFDVSVILPFYKKSNVFEITVAVNSRYLQRNGIEVVIVMDEPTERETLIAIIEKYPLINWRVLINETAHTWRNPAKVINVGIRHASKTYVLVMGPDSEMATDVIYQMRTMADLHAGSFFIGRVAFVDYVYTHNVTLGSEPVYLYYGSIFAPKDALISLGGYDEGYDRWGGEDDNIRARLQRYGLKKLKVPDCILLHRECPDELQQSRSIKHRTNRELPELERSFYPDSAVANPGQSWGTDFNKVIYDWINNPYAEELCTDYLRRNKIHKFEAKPAAFKKRYHAMALVAIHNEADHIPGLLENLESNCDGIIILDDNSSDDSYQLAVSRKLVLKFSKATRDGFDDLGNRNLLLDLASFFSSDYFFFIDADERFDDRFETPLDLAKQNNWDIITFYLVHLWGNELQYRTDIPEKSEFGIPGLIKRYRMFKNIGRMNIRGDKLHFEAVPYKTGKTCVAPILVKHYGMMSESIRQMKYQRYSSEDEKLSANPGKYEYFLDKDPRLNDVAKLGVSAKEIGPPSWKDFLFKLSDFPRK